VTLKRSHRLQRGVWPAGVDVNVVRVWEPNPPKGAEAVEWLLLTSEPVETEADIKAVVEGYRTRWVIEEYFCAVKTGCGFERRQLESAHALFNMLAFCLVLAYVLLLMRSLAREDTRRPAAEVLSPQQLACLRLLSPKGLAKAPTVREALLRVAALVLVVTSEGIAQLQDRGGIQGQIVTDQDVAPVCDVLCIIQIERVPKSVKRRGE